MPKYRIYAKAIASKYIGEFEANNEQEAIEKAELSDACHIQSLCHQCSHEMDIGDIYELEAELVTETN